MRMLVAALALVDGARGVMGKSLKAVLKLVIFLAIAEGAGLYVVVNYSEARQELVCKGHWKDAPQENETAYVEVNEYRPWVRLWSNTRGNMRAQTDKRAMTEYFSDVRRVFDGRLAMYSFHDYDFSNDKLGRFRGGYRAANNEITIEFHPTSNFSSIFIGTCELDIRQ
jgi:hypothetical protein